MGIGVCTYVEVCGLGPSQVAGAIGFQGGLWESAIVRFHPTRQGQRLHRRQAARPGRGDDLRADRRSRARRRRQRREGRCTATPTRRRWAGAPTAAAPPRWAAPRWRWRSRRSRTRRWRLSAHLLEASVEDMDYADGKFFVKGAPAKAKTIQDVALMANVAWNMPAGMEPGLEASSFYDPPNFVFPFGAHCAVVEVDPATGAVDAQALRRRGRLRPADQPDDRRGPGARRRGPGHRPGAVGRGGLRRQRPAPHRHR